MFDKIKYYFKYYSCKNALKKFAKNNNFYLFGWGGLNIDGLVVNEFGYLLRLISDGEINNFLDLEEIYLNKDKLLKGLDREISKNPLWEEAALNISKTLAQVNLENLKNIIEKIDKFVNFYKNLELTEEEVYNITYKYYK